MSLEGLLESLEQTSYMSVNLHCATYPVYIITGQKGLSSLFPISMSM